MTGPHRAPGRASAGTGRVPGTVGGRRLRLTRFDDPRRATPKPLGLATDGPRVLVRWRVPAAGHHGHLIGITGSGKTVWLCRLCIAEAQAGRGVALLDCQGDLGRDLYARLPASCAPRLVIIDPAERHAPPAWNPLRVPVRGSGELVASNVVGVFRRLYASHWGPVMEDTLRAACLTLVRRPGSTLADIAPLLTQPDFRRRVLARYGEPHGLAGFWIDWAAASPAERRRACGPVVSRLRAVFTRRFARDLLATPTDTFTLTDILDGGVLIARLPKGVIGEDCAKLVGSLLLAGLWQAATARSRRPARLRPHASVIVDECQNFLHLPIGVDEVLAEARGYHLSFVLAHQNLGQLPPDIREAVDANARNKFYLPVSPWDAARLVRHVGPFFDEHDLQWRPSFQMTCRIVDAGHHQPPFTLDTLPKPPAIPGRARLLRAAARRHTGLSRAARREDGTNARLSDQPGAARVFSDQPARTAPLRAHSRRRPGERPTPRPASRGSA